MTCVLALDIAMNRSGFAEGGPEWNRPRWGVFETAGWRDGGEAVNLVRWGDFLDERMEANRFTHMVIEHIFVDTRIPKLKALVALLFKKKMREALSLARSLAEKPAFDFAATQAQMMLSGVAVERAARRGIKVFSVTTDEWRERFLGMNRRPEEAKGDDKFWKTLALRRAAELGWYCEFHDQAEALGILDCALAALDKPYRLRTNPRQARAQADIDNKRGIFA